MPASEKFSRAFATTSSSSSNPTVARIGVALLELIVGLALWAATQMEQAAASVCVG
jgi:hypothetical protein